MIFNVYLLGLYEQFMSHFFLWSIISTKKLSAEEKLWLKTLAWISSQICKIISPPFLSRSNLNGAWKLSIEKWPSGKLWTSFDFGFGKCTVTVNLKKFSSNTSLDDKLLRNFILSNSIILKEDLIRWNRGFGLFLIDHYASDTENKNIAGKYLAILVLVSPILYEASQLAQRTISIIPWFIQYMYYLYACNTSLFKSYNCYVLFLPFEKTLQLLWTNF